jgi:transketolase N-terminal domain/subunit
MGDSNDDEATAAVGGGAAAGDIVRAETVVPGVEACTGALGHGLSIGIGVALAARMTGRNSKVYVLMGDGEINEGSVWEAAACADKHRLSNLTAIIDYNKIQSAGSVFDIQSMEPLADKWTSFGFQVFGATATTCRSSGRFSATRRRRPSIGRVP